MINIKSALLLTSLSILGACSTVTPTENTATFSTDVYEVAVKPSSNLSQKEFDEKFTSAIHNINPLDEVALKDAVKNIGTIEIKQKYYFKPQDENASGYHMANQEIAKSQNVYQTTEPLLKSNNNDKYIFSTVSIDEYIDNKITIMTNTRLGKGSETTFSKLDRVEKNKTYLIKSYLGENNSYNALILSPKKTL